MWGQGLAIIGMYVFFFVGFGYLLLRRSHHTTIQDKFIVDLGQTKPGQIINLPQGVAPEDVKFINPLAHQDYVLKKYVAASSAAEAIGLDAQTPVAEVFIREEKVQFQGHTNAVGFQSVHPEEE